MKKYILAIDQGTTGSTIIIFNKQGQIVSKAYREFPQIYPKPGWVEHDPLKIWQSVKLTIADALRSKKIKGSEIAAIGITNQRETTILWDKRTGKPVYNAIVWQCRRTAPICDSLKKKGYENYVQRSTGLKIDAYFSGTKIKWILENTRDLRSEIRDGRIAFGTVDTWIIWNLTKGKVHVTDYTNASRTMLYNIRKLDWDKKLLSALGIPHSILPKVVPSSGVVGHTKGLGVLPDGIPIAGIAGDQQAALFGQTCFDKGDVKNTYGTGCFMLLNTGTKAPTSKTGLVTTIAVGINKRVYYALEGSIFIAGAAVQWIRDGLQIIKNAEETEAIAKSVPDTGGVYFVPAFVGLGAPYWNMYARGTISGITRGTTKAHIVRATLESLAYQTKDVAACMEKDSGLKIRSLKVDGKAMTNNFLAQFQADMLPAKIVRPKILDTTALGAAYLAGLGVGFWKGQAELRALWKVDKLFVPKMNKEKREELYKYWQRSIGAMNIKL
ncbi:glycerol kinase GlpK [Candidatus Margulisiibacteriota bacterium]